MAKFIKKPVAIEAIQYVGTNFVEIINFTGGDASIAKAPVGTNSMWIETLEGGHVASCGDWIIKGVKGEHYPCKPDIFEKTYYTEAKYVEQLSN